MDSQKKDPSIDDPTSEAYRLRHDYVARTAEARRLADLKGEPALVKAARVWDGVHETALNPPEGPTTPQHQSCPACGTEATRPAIASIVDWPKLFWCATCRAYFPERALP